MRHGHVTSSLLRSAALGAALCLITTACGGESEPKTAESVDTDRPLERPPGPDTEMGMEETETEEVDAPEHDAKEEEAVEPEFTDSMSVNEAMAAVPQNTEYIHIDQEALGKPLQDPAVYEPCKVGSKHFTLRVAVWDGRAVGVDVKSNDKQLAECVSSQIRSIEWPDKVKSLNTIEYGM